TDLCAGSGLAGVASPSLQQTSPLCGQSALSAQRCQVMSAWEATLPLDLPVCFIERRACLPAPVVRKIIEVFSSPQILCGVAAPYAPRPAQRPPDQTRPRPLPASPRARGALDRASLAHNAPRAD